MLRLIDPSGASFDVPDGSINAISLLPTNPVYDNVRLLIAINGDDSYIIVVHKLWLYQDLDHKQPDSPRILIYHQDFRQLALK